MHSQELQELNSCRHCVETPTEGLVNRYRGRRLTVFPPVQRFRVLIHIDFIRARLVLELAADRSVPLRGEVFSPPPWHSGILFSLPYLGAVLRTAPHDEVNPGSCDLISFRNRCTGMCRPITSKLLVRGLLRQRTVVGRTVVGRIEAKGTTHR